MKYMYVLTVVATCIVCWGKVVLIVGEHCPCVVSGVSFVCPTTHALIARKCLL